jgi:hypothetical protein
MSCGNRDRLVATQRDTDYTLHNTGFLRYFCCLETDDLSEARDDQEVIGRSDHSQPSEALGLERDLATRAGHFVCSEALHRTQGAFAIGAELEYETGIADCRNTYRRIVTLQTYA